VFWPDESLLEVYDRDPGELNSLRRTLLRGGKDSSCDDDLLGAVELLCLFFPRTLIGVTSFIAGSF